ncbi:MAG: SRPBCC family protein [Gemmatimonadaceae bacterium]
MTIWIETIEPERSFSFRWHPYAVENDVDYSAEPPTLVSFTLEDLGESTRLTIVESGFDAIPESRRAKAFSMNSSGWAGQAGNIRKFIGEKTAKRDSERSARIAHLSQMASDGPCFDSHPEMKAKRSGSITIEISVMNSVKTPYRGSLCSSTCQRYIL